MMSSSTPGSTFVRLWSQPTPRTPAIDAGWAQTSGSPQPTAAPAPPMAAARMEVSKFTTAGGAWMNCARAFPAERTRARMAAVGATFVRGFMAHLSNGWGAGETLHARSARRTCPGARPRYNLGSVIPSCFWYLPALSLYDTSHTSVASKNTTWAMPSLA